MAGCRYHNIDASAFRRGEYVGYAKGVWSIRRHGSGRGAEWRAVHRDTGASIVERTLGSTSKRLEKQA